MSTATVQGSVGSRIHRHVEHVMGMPISLALRGRHAADSAGRAAWAGGVVKGWAVERVAGHLRELADTDFCLSAGGDIICDTVTEDARPWRIGIEDRRDTRRLIAVIPLRAGAVATSGTAHRGAHLVDP